MAQQQHRRIVQLIGLPTDSNSSFLRGPAEAPAAIRQALASDHTSGSAEIGDAFGRNVEIRDRGDLPLREDAGDAALIEAAVSAALAANEMPFCLGGDHSITFPAVKSIAGRFGPLNILHFDAHPDLYDNYQDNPSSHASPFARIMESGLATRLVQVGIRTLNEHQQVQAQRFGVELILMKHFTVESVPVLNEPLYISFDMDSLDPGSAPAVSHYEPGGLTVREVLAVLMRQRGHLVGADLVEYNPTRDIHGMTGAVAAKLIREIAGLASYQ